MICPSCGTANPAGAKFCHQCGNQLAVVCSVCGLANLPVARFCNQCGARLGDDRGAPPPQTPTPAEQVPAETGDWNEIYAREEERRPITILFADLVGFTALADRLDPEQVRELTAITLGRLAREIRQFGGTIDKFLGDAVLALFGAPVAHEDDTERAVGAALAMQQAMAELNESLTAASGGELALRIGINTGLVVVGAREVGGHSEYTAIGDPVNVASRLQNAAQPGTIVVGETTFRAASRRYAFLPLAPLTLRGKPEPVAAFQVLGPLRAGDSVGASRADEWSTPLVGCEQELRSLRYCLEELARGRGQIAFVVGEAGIGKSRLVAELHREYSGHDFQWALARALSYGQHLSYGIFNGTIRELFQPEEYGGESEAALALQTYLDQLGAPEAYPFLAYQLGLPVEPATQAALERLSPHEFLARVIEAIRKWLRSLARERPLVCVVDDVHWADPSSLALLDGLLALADEVPLCFCFLLRPERESNAWQLKERAARDFPHRYTEVVIGPLTRSESSAMIELLVQVPAALSGLQQQILARTEGNPLFIEEVIRDLLERGALTQSDERWELAHDVSLLHVPDSLQSAIIARIDRLRESVRHTIQTAAVLGRDFELHVLASVLGDPRTLEDDLREAQRLELIAEASTFPERRYSFRHALVQEAIYHTLLVRRRKELHGEIARVLEALYADRLEEVYDPLAHHSAHAEDWARVLKYSVLEGDRAATAHATREALEHYRLAWLAARETGDPADLPLVAELLEKLGDVQTLIGLSDEASESYLEALGRVDGTAGQGLGEAGRINLKLARVAMLREDPLATETYLEAATSVLAPDHPEMSAVWSIRAWLQVWTNDYQAAAASAERALERAREDGDFERMTEAYGALAQPALAGIGPRDQLELLDEWIAEARTRGDQHALYSALASRVVNRLWIAGLAEPATLSAAHEAVLLADRLGAEAGARSARGLLGACLFLEGNWRGAESELLAARESELSLGPVEELSAYWLGLLETAQGRFQRGREVLEDGLRSLGFPHSRIWLNQALAWNLQAAGDDLGARTALNRAAEAAERLGCLACSTYFAGVAAELWVALGDLLRAQRYVQEARMNGRALGRKPTLLAADRAEAALLASRGQPDEALALLRPALRLAKTLGQPFELARTALQLGQALALRDQISDRDRARGQVRAALEAFDALGARADLARARTIAATLGLIPSEVRGAR